MRLVKRQAVRFTFHDPNDPDYTLSRTYGSIKQTAQDDELLAFGKALAALLPGDQLANVQVTIASDVEAD